MTQHVIPIGDEQEHLHNVSCWCGPRVDVENDCTIIVHNAKDMREVYEELTDEGLGDRFWGLYPEN